MFPSYYRDRLYRQLIATIFKSSLVVDIKSYLTTASSEEKKKKNSSVVADKTHNATISTEILQHFLPQ